MQVNYQKWIKAFMDSWKNLEGAKTCDLIADKCDYYENPIDPPLKSKAEIVKLWEIVPLNQKDISYKGKILFCDEKHCFYHYRMTRTMVATNEVQQIDGVFELKLNKKNLLTYFKQWRFTKQI